MPAAYDAAAALERIEHELIDSMMRNLRRHLDEETDMGFDWEQWQVLQLKHLETYRKKNLKKYGPQFRQINLRIKHAIQHARVNGQKEEEKEILKTLAEHPELNDVIRPTGNLDIQGGSFFKINEQKLDALVKATENDLTKAEHAVLRRCNDQYRKIIFDAQMYANTGAGTVEKAIDMATHDLIARGIDSIVYKNGSRHTISDYADMAIRTANRRATLMGAGEMRKKYGRTLVIVNRRGTMTGGNFGNACPQCIPWLGKILIDDVYSGGRPDGKHQLVSMAMQQGFLHPRCKDSFHTYYPGITSVPDPVTKKELEAGAAADRRAAERQKAERMMAMHELLAETRLDPENRQAEEARAEEWKERGNYIEKHGDFGKIKTSNTEGEQSRYNPGPDSRAVVAEVVGTDDYAARMKQVGESEKITNIMLYQSRKTLWRRNGTPFEDLIYIDPENGEHLAQRLIDKAGEVGPTEEMKAMVEGKLRKIIAIHNHPHNMLPSLSDLQSAKRYKYSIIVCHDGTIIKFSVNDTANLRSADRVLDNMQSRFNRDEDLSVELSMLSSCGVDMEVIR